MRFKLVHKYAVYIDYTCELTQRPFYVGKGTQSRVNRRERNGLHKGISQTHGRERRVVFETNDAAEAYAHERVLIAEYKTYAYGGEGWWGANLDLGGQGGPDTPKTLEHREKIRQAHIGRKCSDAHRRAMSEGGKGKTLDTDHRRKISESTKRSYKDNPTLQASRRLGAKIANQRRWDAYRAKKLAQAVAESASVVVTATSDVNR